MWHSISRCGVVAGVLMAIACAVAPPAVPESRPAGTGRVHVVVTGLLDDSGQVLVALFLNEDGWPNDASRAFGRAVLEIERGRSETEFADVPAGPFAVSVIHDRDLDRELDTNLFGIPSEAYGFSRDARAAFGPPGFDDARLDLSAGQTADVEVRVR